MDLLEKEWYIQAPWGRLCIIVWGNCQDPPVLLCHGSADSAATFRPLMKYLPKGFYYIGLELPGNGRSDRFPPGLMISSYDMMYSIQAVVKHFRWETFVYIGHSFGAILGKLYNISYPGKISKIIELDPWSFRGVPPDQFPRWYKLYFSNYYENYDKYNLPKEKSKTYTWQEAIDQVMTKRGLPKEAAIATLERWTEPAGNGLIRFTIDPRARVIYSPPFDPEHIKELFTKLKTPTLFIAAEESVRKKLYGNTAFLLDETIYPARNFRMRQVDGGHEVHASHPERVAGYISQFLLYGVKGLDSIAKL